MKRALRFTFIFITFLFLLGSLGFAYEEEIKSLSGDIAPKIVKAKKRVIAVVDFTDLQGNVTELGRFLAEELSVSLAASEEGFEIVDRTQLKALVKEYNLSITGSIDSATAQKVGQIAGSDALITGTITPFGDFVRLAVKVLDTSNANIITASTVTIAKTKGIVDLLSSNTSHIKASVSGIHINSNPNQVKEQKNIKFELREVYSLDTSVIFEIVVTNTGEDYKDFSIYGYYNGQFNTYFYDFEGNEYVKPLINFGNKSGVTDSVPFFAKGIPTNLKLTFNTSSKISKIRLLIIRCSIGIITFENIYRKKPTINEPS